MPKQQQISWITAIFLGEIFPYLSFRARACAHSWKCVPLHAIGHEKNVEFRSRSFCVFFFGWPKFRCYFNYEHRNIFATNQFILEVIITSCRGFGQPSFENTFSHPFGIVAVFWYFCNILLAIWIDSLQLAPILCKIVTRSCWFGWLGVLFLKINVKIFFIKIAITDLKTESPLARIPFKLSRACNPPLHVDSWPI